MIHIFKYGVSRCISSIARRVGLQINVGKTNEMHGARSYGTNGNTRKRSSKASVCMITKVGGTSESLKRRIKKANEASNKLNLLRVEKEELQG